MTTKNEIKPTAPAEALGAPGSASSELPAGTARACPFCGCPRIGAAEYPDHKGGRVWMVFCGEGTCSARVLAKTKDRAIAKWQREPNVEISHAEKKP